ncbi:MAG TPA: FAD-dependent oxidoreductase [Candidatus Babeliales bacterium]|nr:FAD-dependent oxidoreductase [Candidatus Babeliales bacterium]
MLNNLNIENYDVIIVGAGHAGAEAAYAAAKLGSKTALVTLDLNKISLMPCNPSIGGVGKGQIVFEISALGGLMPQLCTQTYLQARMLNTRKGPAVHGLRLQIDKHAYSKLSREKLAELPNLTLLAGCVDSIIIEHNIIQGVEVTLKTSPAIPLDDARGERDKNPLQINLDQTYNTKVTLKAPTVVLTTGTFLNGLLHTGHINQPGGRRDEQAVTTLAQFLKQLGLKIGRLKTGTPPRLLRSSIDFSKLEAQDAHELNYLYEFHPLKVAHKLPCYIAYTNPVTHQTILDNAIHSPIFAGKIQGKPPRYCPSIEDKIMRFADKSGHHVFVEPEDATYEEIYPSGLSTAMPIEVQEKFIRTIEGFEQAIITKAGYAVEYDYVCPSQLSHSLELKAIPGLFLAGQINGTTGYEEAAGQGIIAGINAHLKAKNLAPFTLSREESYIGVMIDDLVTLGVEEPYRMFTSRAERRIVLRQDNSFMRLSPKAYQLGMLSENLYREIAQENNAVLQALENFRSTKTDAQLLKLFGELECDPQAIYNLAKLNLNLDLSGRAIEIIYAEIKYAEYIKREQKEIDKSIKYRDLAIPATLDFKAIPGLSKELQEKLIKYQPQNIAEANLIKGMTPAAISLLIFKSRLR